MPVSPTKYLVHIALFAALFAALGIFPPLVVPLLGVPVTAQSMGVMLAGGILGARRGASAAALFLILVAAGLPLLSGGRGGLGVFAGPSGGFVMGYFFGAWVCGFLTERMWGSLNHVKSFLISAAGGIGVVYALGIPWIVAVTDLTPVQALTGSAAFIPGDLIKAVCAAAVIMTVRRAYPLIAPAGAGNGRA